MLELTNSKLMNRLLRNENVKFYMYFLYQLWFKTLHSVVVEQEKLITHINLILLKKKSEKMQRLSNKFSLHYLRKVRKWLPKGNIPEVLFLETHHDFQESWNTRCLTKPKRLQLPCNSSNIENEWAVKLAFLKIMDCRFLFFSTYIFSLTRYYYYYLQNV